MNVEPTYAQSGSLLGAKAPSEPPQTTTHCPRCDGTGRIAVGTCAAFTSKGPQCTQPVLDPQSRNWGNSRALKEDPSLGRFCGMHANAAIRDRLVRARR